MTARREVLSEFKRRYFKGSRPCVNTLKSWIDKKLFPGEVIAGHYFVLVDECGEPINSNQAMTGNVKADQILTRWAQQ